MPKTTSDWLKIYVTWWSSCLFGTNAFILKFLQSTMNPFFHQNGWAVVALVAVLVVLALKRCNREPSSISAIIIKHMVGPNPNELVALVDAKLSNCRFIPPILLLIAAATLLRIICCCHCCRIYTRIDLKARIGFYIGCMAPFSLYPITLCGPIISILYGTIDSHRLILGEWYALILLVRVFSYRCLIY